MFVQFVWWLFHVASLQIPLSQHSVSSVAVATKVTAPQKQTDNVWLLAARVQGYRLSLPRVTLKREMRVVSDRGTPKMVSVCLTWVTLTV